MVNKREGKNSILQAIGGTFSLTLSTVIVKLLGLIYKIPLASLLGDEGMGFFNSAYTVYTFFYLLCTAGVPKAVMILVSESRAKGNAVEERRIVEIASKMFFSLGLVVMILFMLLSPTLANLIGNSRAAATMLCVAPSILFVSLAGVIRGYLSAQLRLLDVAISQIIEGVGRLVLGLVLAIWSTKQGYTLEIVSALTILGVSLGAFLGLAYMLICSKMLNKGKKAGQRDKNGDILPLICRILRISLPITLSAAIMSITNIIDLGLIMRNLIYIGYTEVEAGALYGNYTTLAVPMFNLAIALITPISIAHLPLFTESFIKADALSSVKAERNALRLSAFIAAPITAGFIVFAKEILTMLFPNNETQVGASLLCILTAAIPFSATLLITNTMLEASGNVKAPLVSMLFGSIAKIIVSYLLIRNPEFGISGAPIGTVLSYAVALMSSLIICSKKFNKKIPIIRYSLSFYIFAVCSVLTARVVFYRIERFLSEQGSLIVSIIISAVLYLIITLFYEYLTQGKKEKRQNIQISKFKIIQ